MEHSELAGLASTATRRLAGERQCAGINSTTGVRCKRYPIPGGDVCILHGGGSALAQQAAKRRLMAMVEPALAVLFDCISQCVPEVQESNGTKFMFCKTHGLECPEWRDKLSAAKTLLDRAGFAAKTTIALEIAEQQEDLSRLDRNALAKELDQLSKQLTVIDVPVTHEQTVSS